MEELINSQIGTLIKKSEEQPLWTPQEYRIQALDIALKLKISRVDASSLIYSAKQIYEFILNGNS